MFKQSHFEKSPMNGLQFDKNIKLGQVKIISWILITCKRMLKWVRLICNATLKTNLVGETNYYPHNNLLNNTTHCNYIYSNNGVREDRL